MSEPLEGLLKRVLALDENDRASLAGALIESLHGESQGGSDTAWETEIRRRVTELDARGKNDSMVRGQGTPLPWVRVNHDGIRTQSGMPLTPGIGTPSVVR
jgi:hypothetical protein